MNLRKNLTRLSSLLVTAILLILSESLLCVDASSAVVASTRNDEISKSPTNQNLLQSFVPKRSKAISAHGRNDGDGLFKSSYQPGCARIFIRAIRMIVLFSPSIVTAWLAILVPQFQSLWFRLLALSLAHSGAAFIKWGQVSF